MVGAWSDMAADQDVPVQADHHQPGWEPHVCAKKIMVYFAF